MYARWNSGAIREREDEMIEICVCAIIFILIGFAITIGVVVLRKWV